MSGEPKSIGRYQLIAPLGEGGMARVFLAVSRGPAGFNKLIVIKVIKRELIDQSDFIDMFFDEARLAARLNHPNVVQTYEVGEDGGHHFLTMEFLEGQPLSQLLARVGRADMPLPEHLWILTKVLTGLHYAHELRDFDGSPLNVVHRDVSPANVFVTYNGQVKLVDFGVAKATGALAVTQKGMFKGKFGYGAPEQMLEKPVDRRADVFAVGVLLWEALACKSLSAGRGLQPLVTSRVSGCEPKIRDVAPDVDERLAELCERAMALDSADRFATAAAFRDELEEYLDGWGRRVTSRDVAALITDAFEADRTKMRHSIEVSVRRPPPDLLGENDAAQGAALAAGGRPESGGSEGTLDPAGLPADGAAAAEPVPDTKPSRGVSSEMFSDALPTLERPAADLAPTPNTVGGVAVGDSQGGSTAGGPQETTKPSPGAESRSGRSARILPLSAVAVVGAIIGVAVVLLSHSNGDLESRQPSAPAGEPALEHGAVGTDSVEPSTAVHDGATIELRISVIPSDATVTLDGKRLHENPFYADVTRERATHVVRAAADGFVSQERLITYGHSVRVELELEPESSPKHPSKGSAPKATAPSLRPGVDLRPSAPTATQPGRRIDETDPYAK